MNELLKAVTAQMGWVEMLAAVATLVTVWLTAKNSIWNWPWGVVAVLLYTAVFLQQKLYSSTGLQVVYYLPMQFYGWWVWLRCGPRQDDDLPVTRLSPSARLFWLAANVPLALVLGYVMGRFGAALSYWDAAVTAMSVTAQYLLTHKRIENWLLWIAVDVLYAFYLFPQQHLYVSAVLYAILLVLAAVGYTQWHKLMLKQERQTPEPAVP